ncbi:MAG: hypothetical protein LRY69_06695 [Gammaproteobacteria bacterium]|nr:hypothetical protein [Gammaproteobacteria bacterium]
MERWGTGTNKMIALCKQDELPEPEFEEHTGGFSVILKFKTPMRSDFSSKPTFSEHTLLSERQKKNSTNFSAVWCDKHSNVTI